jgi:hypothetical protein
MVESGGAGVRGESSGSRSRAGRGGDRAFDLVGGGVGGRTDRMAVVGVPDGHRVGSVLRAAGDVERDWVHGGSLAQRVRFAETVATGLVSNGFSREDGMWVANTT